MRDDDIETQTIFVFDRQFMHIHLFFSSYMFIWLM